MSFTTLEGRETLSNIQVFCHVLLNIMSFDMKLKEVLLV
jgi:hypothetical protein